MIVEDRLGVQDVLAGKTKKNVREGGWRPGLIYKSEDGINWGTPEIALDTNRRYFGGRLVRNERPHILWKNGKPEHLFITTHGSPMAGYYLKINDWKP